MSGYGEFKRAADIKAPAADEEELDWILYDEDASGTTASADVTFFDHSESADTKADTNLPIAGQLPPTQRFSVNSIQVEFDHEMATGDLPDILDNAVLELEVNQRRKIIGPLSHFVQSGQLRPLDDNATTDNPLPAGQPYFFTNPIGIPGGTDFKAVVTVGQTAASASSEIRVMLLGLLIRSK